MAEYSKIFKKMWNNGKFRQLSDDAKLLWIYLLSNQHVNTIGMYVIDKYYILGDLKWLPKRLGKPFAELFQKGLICHFEIERVIIIPSWFEHNTIDNPNQLKKAEAELSEIPQVVLRQIVNKGLMKRLPKGLTERLPKGLPYSETETETETEVMSGKPDPVIPFQEIINDLNQVLDKNYKASTKVNRQLIKTRWTEGFRLEDFKTVHRNQYKLWKDDKKMEIYLRPITLYGNKFESYLNSKAPTPKTPEKYDPLAPKLRRTIEEIEL